MHIYSVIYGFGLFVVVAEDERQAAALVADGVKGATADGVLERGTITAVEATGDPRVVEDYWA